MGCLTTSFFSMRHNVRPGTFPTPSNAGSIVVDIFRRRVSSVCVPNLSLSQADPSCSASLDVLRLRQREMGGGVFSVCCCWKTVCERSAVCASFFRGVKRRQRNESSPPPSQFNKPVVRGGGGRRILHSRLCLANIRLVGARGPPRSPEPWTLDEDKKEKHNTNWRRYACQINPSRRVLHACQYQPPTTRRIFFKTSAARGRILMYCTFGSLGGIAVVALN